MEDNKKPKFIRKNGKIIPVGVDKSGKEKKPKNKNVKGGKKPVEKNYLGKAVISAAKMKRERKKAAEKRLQFATVGAVGGYMGFRRMKRGKAGAVAGLIAGGIVGRSASKENMKKSEKHRKEGIKYLKKDKKQQEQLKKGSSV